MNVLLVINYTFTS